MKLFGILAWGTLGSVICSASWAQQPGTQQPTTDPQPVQQTSAAPADQSSASASGAAQQPTAGDASSARDAERIQKLEDEVARLRAEEANNNEQLSKVLAELEAMKKAGPAPAPTSRQSAAPKPVGQPPIGPPNQPASSRPARRLPAAIFQAAADPGGGMNGVPAMSPAAEPRTTNVLFPGLVTRMDIAARFANNYFEDPLELLQNSNERVGLFRARVYFDTGTSPVSGPQITSQVMLTTGAADNPTIPFIRLGRQDRATPFDLDRAFFKVKPKPTTIPGLDIEFGKMFNPFWRGDYRNDEIVWDDDVNPEGLAVHTPLTAHIKHNDLKFLNTFSYIIFGNPIDNRFVGITRDYDLLADQISVEHKNLKLALSYYDYRGLNSGLYVASFNPNPAAAGAGVAVAPSANILTPGTDPFLLRPPLQNTNNNVGYGGFSNSPPAGEAARDSQGFVSDIFEIYNVTAQYTLPEVVKNKTLYVMGNYVQNARVRLDGSGYSALIGARSKSQGKIGNFNSWLIYRYVGADAVLADYADSDLGGGSNYYGVEVGGNVQVLPNTQVQLRLFNYDATPFGFREKLVRRRLFFDIIRSF